METYLNSRRVVFIALLLLIVSLLYSSTFYAPFNFDDEVVIKLETEQQVKHPRIYGPFLNTSMKAATDNPKDKPMAGIPIR